jgi:hypothetical protein
VTRLFGRLVFVASLIHVLKPDPAASDAERVAELATAGCRDQALLLLALIAQPAR